ncbi:hypothetical protein MSG28_010906 [Choristoneura fumiferana]|uniref:Uncharacterized protein n=1 Tax=Choristoneura fumiferana TaxID=7141 RepID=A0ACC0KPU7_CHOFU|nr:hypothetical protein MSG28_010906 [Choristoneura fumiferana]
MVKLTGVEEQPAMERWRRIPQAFQGPRARSHHLWGSRFGRQREEMKLRLSPTSLSQLEEMVETMVSVIEKHSPKSAAHYQMVMQLLRDEHNLTFAMVGDNCPGSYDPDELDAPER